MVKSLDKVREDAQQRVEAAKKDAPTYKVRSATEILGMNVEQPDEIWGGFMLANDIYELIGPPGIGKSRILLNIALTQCLADTQPDGEDSTFAGLPVSKKPLKWLLIGTENSLYRYYGDLEPMMKNTDEAQRKALDKRLFMTTLEGEGDSYIAVNNPQNVEKLRATLEKIQPNIVTFDPWGDVCVGSETDDQSVRDTVHILRDLRNATKKTMPIIIVNHSRMGAQENVKVRGLDAGNYGKNSKALYSIARCVWNLGFLSQNPDDHRIAMIHAKCSYKKTYSERCIALNPEYMTYDYKEDVNVGEILRKMDVDVHTPAQNRAENRKASRDAQINDGVNAILKYVEENGATGKGELTEILKGIGCSDRNCNVVFTKLTQENGFIGKKLGGSHGLFYYGTQEQIDKKSAEIKPKEK